MAFPIALPAELINAKTPVGGEAADDLGGETLQDPRPLPDIDALGGMIIKARGLSRAMEFCFDRSGGEGGRRAVA